MSFFKVITYILLFSTLFLLTGCSERTERSVSYTNDSPFQEMLSQGAQFNAITAQADMYIGNLPFIEYEKVGNQLIYLGQTFLEVPYPERISIFYDCRWQLDCSYAQIMGLTKDHTSVYAFTDDESTIKSLLLVNTDRSTVSWYILEEIYATLDICAYSLSDFDVEFILGETTQHELEKIWAYHTKELDANTYDVMLDKAEYHTCFFINKEQPWLVYELNYCYTLGAEKHLYIYNVPKGNMVFLTKNGEDAF